MALGQCREARVIDWRDPEPDFVKPHLGVELRTMDDAIALLDQWQAAEATTWREYLRLHEDYCEMKRRAEFWESLAGNYEHLYKIALEPQNDEIREALREVA